MKKFNFENPKDFEEWNNLTDEQYEEWKGQLTQEEWDSLVRYLFSNKF